MHKEHICDLMLQDAVVAKQYISEHTKYVQQATAWTGMCHTVCLKIALCLAALKGSMQCITLKPCMPEPG